MWFENVVAKPELGVGKARVERYTIANQTEGLVFSDDESNIKIKMMYRC
jgi:hypothetical protein